MNLPSAPIAYLRDTWQSILNELRREDARNVKGVTGIWTPTLGDGTNNFTLGTAWGRYVKKNDEVTAHFRCDWSGIGSAGATRLKLGPLPFPSLSVANASFAASFAYIDGVDNNGGKQILGFLENGDTTIDFWLVNDNASPNSSVANACSATGVIAGSITYITG